MEPSIDRKSFTQTKAHVNYTIKYSDSALDNDLILFSYFFKTQDFP